jgi:hypothetical protein
MLIKWILLLQVTLSQQQAKIKKLKPVGKLVRSNPEKIRGGLKGFRGDNMVVDQWLRLRRLFKLLLCLIDFHGNKTYDPLILFTLSLLLLRKLLLFSIFIICKLIDDLLDELIKGN